MDMTWFCERGGGEIGRLQRAERAALEAASAEPTAEADAQKLLNKLEAITEVLPRVIDDMPPVAIPEDKTVETPSIKQPEVTAPATNRRRQSHGQTSKRN
jgi:hypothetical protein